MPCIPGSFNGREVAVYYAIGCPETQPTAEEYMRLGMMRGKSTGVEWDTDDVTADLSPANTRENNATYKNISFSGDGITRTEDAYAQKVLKRHVYKPSDETGGQPLVWFKIVSPIDITEGPFLVTKWENDDPYDGASTWSIEASSAGDVDIRDA